jgi:hypothetical protein
VAWIEPKRNPATAERLMRRSPGFVLPNLDYISNLKIAYQADHE